MDKVRLATMHLQGSLGSWKPPLQGMRETTAWVPAGGGAIQKECAWCPGPGCPCLPSCSALGPASTASWAEQRVRVQQNWAWVLVFCLTSASRVSLSLLSPHC